MVDILDKVQGIAELGKSTEEKQRTINVSEVFYVWELLAAKYDILDSTNLVENFINDPDLKYITHKFKTHLEKSIKELDKLISNYGIPYPVRPPVENITTAMFEHFTDRFVYEEIFASIQFFFPIISSAFMNSTSPKVSKIFKNFLLEAVELQELIIEYGKLKGFLVAPHVYKA
ncbi:MAG: DUF3231 family protein [Desulfitobacteriia bacterium]|jgi:hypothetical protein